MQPSPPRARLDEDRLCRQHRAPQPRRAAWPTIPSSSSPAPPPGSAPPRLARPPPMVTASCSPPARRTSWPTWPPSWGAGPRAGRALRRHRVGRPGGDGARDSRRTSGASTSSWPTPGSAPSAASPRRRRSTGESMVLTNVYGAALTIRATIPALRKSRGSPAAHRLGRRPPRASGLALLGTKWAVTAMGEAARAGAQRHRGAGHADRAGHGRHAVLREPPG